MQCQSRVVTVGLETKSCRISELLMNLKIRHDLVSNLINATLVFCWPSGAFDWYLQHVRGQQSRLDDIQTHKLGAQTDDFIEGIDNSWADQEEPEARRGSQPPQTVDHRQNVQNNVETVHFPEEVVSFLADNRMGKDENQRHRDEEQQARYARQRTEEPIRYGRFVITR